jgi:Predicted membrane protein (DUF2079)
MSKVIVAPSQASPGPPPAPAGPLRRVRRIGYVVLGVQLTCFLAWSTFLYSRYALTSDFAADNQAWFLIAHGHLDPYSTVQGYPVWRDHSEFLLWPLALLYWVWPHGVTLLWLQDVCLVGAEAVAFTWLCELTGRRQPGQDAAWLGGAGLVLLAANPWMWWVVSYDFHIEVVAILFAALLARDLANGRRRAWVWVAPLLACGDVAGTYLAGIGLGGVLAGRRWRVTGADMACLGVLATLVITLVNGNQGSGLQIYAYLTGTRPHGSSLSLGVLVTGIVTHPLLVLRTLWAKRVDILANLAPAGLVGLCDVLVLPLMLVVLLANALYVGLEIAEPVFQNVPVYVLLPVGAVTVLGRLMRRHRGAALLLTGLLVAQTVGWAAVWAPRVPGQWLRVPPALAATLASIDARIPASAEVVASQQVVGRFSGRADVYALFRPAMVTVRGVTWFVITPSVGVEPQTTASAMALIGELAGPLRATLVTHANGVWAFRWRPSPGVHRVLVPGDSAPLPAWAAPMAPGTVGRPVMARPASTWCVTTAAGRGYVADELIWHEPPGRYQVQVTLSTTGPVNVQVWDDNGNVLLARRNVPGTTGVESVVLPVHPTTVYQARLYSGWGPFQADFVPPPGGELEVRVWSPGGYAVSVYRAEIARASSRAARPERGIESKGS